MKQETNPDFETLIDWLEGRLPDAEAQRVAAQVAAGDNALQADVAWLRKFFRASHSLALPAPPTAVTNSLESQFAAYARSRRGPSPWQRLLATLTFDSHTMLAAGARATTTQDQRQLVFTTAVATVVCTIQRRERGEQVDLLGQILPTDEEELETDSIQVQLLQERTPFDVTLTNDLGEFNLQALPVGFYDMILSSNRYAIVISSMHLTA